MSTDDSREAGSPAGRRASPALEFYRLRIGAHHYEIDDETGERIYRTESERRERLQDLAEAECDHCGRLIISANLAAAAAHASEADAGFLFDVASAALSAEDLISESTIRNARQRGLRSDRRYCSNACRQAAYRRRQSATRNEE